MPTVKFTKALQRFFPNLAEADLPGQTLPEVLEEMEKRYPGLRGYIVDEQGRLRQHVNIFIDGDLIHDRQTLGDAFRADSEIFFMQALSGG